MWIESWLLFMILGTIPFQGECKSFKNNMLLLGFLVGCVLLLKYMLQDVHGGM